MSPTASTGRPGIAFTVVALALSALVAAAWGHRNPVLADDAPIDVLTTFAGSGSSRLALDEIVRATLTEPVTMQEDIDADGPFPVRRQRMQFAAELPRDGRYSVYGIAANDLPQPVELWINGRPVSAMAFYQARGQLNDGFGVDRIAPRVQLRAGENRITLTGGRLPERTLLLRFRAERPAPLRQWVLPFALALVGFWLSWWVGSRLVLRPREQLWMASLIIAAALAAIPAIGWWTGGADLVRLGHRHPELVRRMQAMESYLSSDERRDDDGRFSVAVFGDSTHYLKLPPERQMIPQLRAQLPAEEREAVEFFGMSAGGMAAWDYYLLTNRALRERPQLVLLPVNASSFSPGWTGNVGYRFPILERYLRPSELPRALGLRVADRRFDVRRLARQRLDLWLFDGRATPLFRGMQVYFGEQRRMFEGYYGARWQRGAPVPAPLTSEQVEASWWLESVGDDHDLFDLFAATARLARAHGAELLLYNVPEDPVGPATPPTPPETIDRLFERLGKEPGVRTLRLPPALTADHFFDRWIHLDAEGLSKVAERLSAEVVRIKRETRDRHPSAE